MLRRSLTLTKNLTTLSPTPYLSHSFPLRQFSIIPEKPTDLAKPEDPERFDISQFKYVYYPIDSIEKLHDKNFITLLKKIEKERWRPHKYDYWNLRFAGVLSVSGLLFHYLWNNCPYSVTFKHLALTEYINRKWYVHAIFCSAISYHHINYFLMFYPVMCYSFLLCATHMKNRHFMALFVFNALLSYGVTYYTQKIWKKEENIKNNETIIVDKKKEIANPSKRPVRRIRTLANKMGEWEKPKYENYDSNVLFPKIVGATTSYAFMNCAMVMYPNYLVFGMKF